MPSQSPQLSPWRGGSAATSGDGSRKDNQGAWAASLSRGATTNCSCPSNPWRRSSRCQESEKWCRTGTSAIRRWPKLEWRAEDAVQEAEVRLRHRKLVRMVIQGRAGLGSFPTPQLNASGKGRRSQVQEEVRASVEETTSCKAVGMKHQGAWTRWENGDLVWDLESQAVYDMFPSPSNLHTWGLNNTFLKKAGYVQNSLILICVTRFSLSRKQLEPKEIIASTRPELYW